MSRDERFSSRGKLWVNDPSSRLVKGMVRRVMRTVHRIIPVKERGAIRNPRVGFIYDRFTEIIKRPECDDINDLMVQFRDFVVLLCDDDRAYFYAFNLLAVNFFLHLPDFYVSDEDFYLSVEERRKFNVIKENVSRILGG